MKVSIVTSVLNGGKSLIRCMESVAFQTYPCEHVVVDGGSTDGSQNIARITGLRVIDAPDSNISEALNIGIQNSNGEVIAILNADDWFERDAVERSVNALQTQPETGFTYGSIILHFDHFAVIVHPRAMPNELAKHAIKQLPFPHISSFVRRSVYDRYGTYNIKFKVAMDYQFYANIITQGVKGAYVDGVIAHASAGGKSSNTLFRLREYNLVLSSYHNRLASILYLTKFAINSIIYNSASRNSFIWRIVNSTGNRNLLEKIREKKLGQ